MWKVYRQRIHRDVKNEMFLNNELEILQIEIATLSIWVERDWGQFAHGIISVSLSGRLTKSIFCSVLGNKWVIGFTRIINLFGILSHFTFSI